jgi:hypothetical protein
MEGHVYSISQVVGSSDKSIEQAVDTAIATAAKTVKNLEWFEVSEIRGHIEAGRVAHYQVTLKLGFRYEK